MSMEYIRRTKGQDRPGPVAARLAGIPGRHAGRGLGDRGVAMLDERAVKKQECKLPGFSAKAKAVQVALPL